MAARRRRLFCGKKMVVRQRLRKALKEGSRRAGRADIFHIKELCFRVTFGGLELNELFYLKYFTWIFNVFLLLIVVYIFFSVLFLVHHILLFDDSFNCKEFSAFMLCFSHTCNLEKTYFICNNLYIN